MNLLLISLIIIILIFIIVIIIVILKNKNENEVQSNITSNIKTQSIEKSKNTETRELTITKSSNSESTPPEEIEKEPEEPIPKELSQAEILKAEIMKEVLQEQQADFDKELENQLNLKIFDIPQIQDYFNFISNSKASSQINKFTLITKDNIKPFKIIIPSYNPTNGAHFIYTNIFFILENQFSTFIDELHKVLEDFNLVDDFVFEDDYVLSKTYTNTSTPSYRFNQINKNINFKTIFFINTKEMKENTKIYTYQSNKKDIEEIEDKVKEDGTTQINIPGFNINGYCVESDEFDKYVELILN